MHFSDLPLAKRLERAEGFACAQCAESRQRLFPQEATEWVDCAGTYAVFNGPDSPITQSFGLGLFEELTPRTLDTLEAFFTERHTPVVHEVSPFAGVAALDLLCTRNYRPIELSSVLYRPVEQPPAGSAGDASARSIHPDEAPLWTDISARGWSVEHPEFLDAMRQFGATIAAAGSACTCFLASSSGMPGAAGVLWIHEGIALFGGASTIPDLRRRGLQQALLRERMRYAAEAGCDLAMMVTALGSESQRNAERTGFRVAYTRAKWQLLT